MPSGVLRYGDAMSNSGFRASTEWAENVAPDEEERYARYARDFAELQQKKSATYGKGRGLHRKQHVGLRGRLEVLADLPDHARHGLFAAPATYDARIRLSNGSADRGPDSRPDVRGFAIKVDGVTGASALGGETSSQDFLLINHSSFSFPTSDEFVGLALAAVRGPSALFGYFVKRYGFFAAFKQLKKVKTTFDKPFSGFATEPFFSAAPIQCGPYAAKVRMLPASTEPSPGAKTDLAADLAARVARGPLHFDLQLQFFIDATRTPIEDASVEWADAPFVTVARLELPRQEVSSPEGKALAEAIEAATFDPWSALAAHRPLGDVMRARKVVYFASQKGRA